MRRLFSKNARLALTALPVAVGCALARQGDPPLPIVEGAGGEGTGGSSATGGSSKGGSAGSTPTGGSAGSTPTGGSAGSTPTGGSAGSTPTGGSAGSTPTGGSAGQGGTATGGSAGSTGGSAGKGGSAGSTTGGTGGATGGSAGKGGSAGTATGGSAGKGGMSLFSDNFEMGTSNWSTTGPGTWSTLMDGTTAYAGASAPSNTTWRAATAGEASWTDVQVDARVKPDWVGSGSGYYAGVCVRYQSEDACACFALRSNGQVMFRVNNDTNTAAANPPGGAIMRNTWYNIRVVARGNAITAFVNGVEIQASSRVTSGAPASGRLALAAPGTNARFDDIVVTTPP